MTLSRQLMLTGIMLFLILFVGVETYFVRNAQFFFGQQLVSHSQDTATALGLTLTSTMKAKDQVTASRIVDVVWDRGYYSSIVVTLADGSVVVAHTTPIGSNRVPRWFMELIPIQVTKQEALIMDGWLRIGNVVVESNPGFAYEQIWKTFVQSVQWLIFTFVIAFVVGGLLIHIILKPLHAITQQAVSICNQEFVIQKKLPRIVDLRKVVEAMNNMSLRLKKMFEDQSIITTCLREQVYEDPVTKLPNRRYFDLQFDFFLQEREGGIGGILLLLEVLDLKGINQTFSYYVGDKLLIQVANVLREACKNQDNAIVTHAKGASFFIVLPAKARLIGESLAEEICLLLKEMYSRNLSPVKNVAHIGLVSFSPGDLKKDVMSQADMAVRTAQFMGENTWYSADIKPYEVHTATEWMSIFQNALTYNNILFYHQEIQVVNTKVKHPKLYEILMRIKTAETVIPASIFMPMAEQFDMMVLLDRAIIENTIKKILAEQEDILYFVNISPKTLEHLDFQQWILNKIKLLGERAHCLAIEFPEQVVVHRIESVREFFQQVLHLGGKTSIDHYGNSFSPLSYLFNLKLNYLKIDGGFVRNIHLNEGNQFFIRSLVGIAHSLDIFILAVAVETQEEYSMLCELKVDGMQGNYISKPTDIGI